jgi:hypothetical protein
MSTPPSPPPPKSKEDRLAEALKANLKRRKQGPPAPGPPAGSDKA